MKIKIKKIIKTHYISLTKEDKRIIWFEIENKVFETGKQSHSKKKLNSAKEKEIQI